MGLGFPRAGVRMAGKAWLQAARVFLWRHLCGKVVDRTGCEEMKGLA